MITLDTNINLPSSSFYYLLQKIRRKYGYTSQNIENYTQSYAANGVPQTNNAQEVEGVDQTNDVNAKDSIDYEALINDLKLNLPENRFAILLQLPTSVLFEMLQLLGKENLLNGLKFFSKEKLMGLIGGLPKPELLQMLFAMFTDKAQLIDNLPTSELHRFLTSDKIEKGHLMKTFELMPKDSLATITGYISKKNCNNMSKPELLQEINNAKKFNILDGIKKLGDKNVRELVTTMTDSFPKLYNEFSHLALFNVADRFAKTDLIESMTVIDDSRVINMLGELPDKLLALTVSQIDPQVFATLLLKDYKDLLANLVLG